MEWTEREVQLPARPAALAGTLLLPDSAAHAPGVVILGDAGPVDRDGNLPGLDNDSLLHLARDLAGCGIASVRPDRRGIGFSAAAGPDEDALTIESYAADAAGWVGFLRAQPQIGVVSLIGHGVGGLVASLAAERGPLHRLVLLEAPGRPFGAILRARLAELGLAPVLRRRAEATLAALEQGRTVDDPPAGLASLFRPGAQPYLISVLRLDPAAVLARSTMPALVIQGTADLEANAADADRLAASRAGVARLTVPGMSHVLRIALPDRAANMRLYQERAVPLAAGLAARICTFIGR